MARFFDLALALFDALSAAHEKDVVHRDLKPANIMVSADGRVKVLDFGLARFVEPVGLEDSTTRLGLTVEGTTIVGTMPYMSPERIEGLAVDHRTDLFSLGVVLYEMATGGRPFIGDSSAALMSSILRDAPSRVRWCALTRRLESRHSFPSVSTSRSRPASRPHAVRGRR